LLPSPLRVYIAFTPATGKFNGRFGAVVVNNNMHGQPSTIQARPGGRTNDVTRLLTADEVASRLGVQPSWVNKAARADRIPHVCVGRYRRFRWLDIEAWLENQRRGS
jgi:excisionase family DNA binding protein